MLLPPSNETDRQVFEKIHSFITRYTGNSDSLYWYPLANLQESIPVAAYDLDRLYADNRIPLLENLLSKCHIRYASAFQMQLSAMTMHEVDLFTLLHEKDDTGYSFPWNTETFYYDNSRKWLIYVSHEGTITFTGDEIVTAAKAVIAPDYLI